MPYDNLSDAELETELARVKSSKAPAPAPGVVDDPYPGLTDAELEYKLARAKAGVNAPPEVLQEMHPDFTEADRLVVKNFANDPAHAASYLQNRHPNLEVTGDKKGQYLARAKGSSEPYRVLDPDTGIELNPFNAETWRDAGDLVTDVGQGALSGAATAAGGVVGALGGFGVGALPAAAVAGAGSNAGLEALKQKLGVALGVNKEVSGLDVGLAAATGGVSPLLFGTGAGTTQLAKGVLRSGAEDVGTALSKAALAQRGAVKRVYDATPLAWAGAKLSGASEDVLKVVAHQQERLTNLLDSDHGLRDFLGTMSSDLKQGFIQKIGGLAGAQKQAAQEAGHAGERIDPGALISRLKEEIRVQESLARQGGGTEGASETVPILKGLLDEHFMADGVQSVATKRQVPSGVLDEYGKPLMKEVTDYADKKVRVPVKSITPEAALSLERRLGDVAGNGSLKAAPGGAGVGPMAGQTESSRTLMRTAQELKGNLKGQVLGSLGDGAEARRAELARVVNLQKEVQPLIANPRTAYATGRNLDVTSNLTNKELFRDIDKTLPGMDMVDRAKVLQAVEQFSDGRGSWFKAPLSRSRVPLGVAGGILGGYLGYNAGEGGGESKAIIGAAAGGAGGAFFGSPAMMKSLIQGTNWTGKKAELLKSLGLPETIGKKQIPALLQMLGMGGAAPLGQIPTRAGLDSAWNNMKSESP